MAYVYKPNLKDFYYLEKNWDGFPFGAYLKCVRIAGNITLRQLSKDVNKSTPYLSDIENGQSKAPDRELLDKLIGLLPIPKENRSIVDHLYDLAARERNDFPSDIKDYTIKKPDLIQLLRHAKKNSEFEKALIEFSKSYKN